MFCIENNLGNYIKEYRGTQSLREFAKKCDISHTHLDSIEKGIDPRTGKKVHVTVDTLKKIAKAMNITVNELLIRSDEIDMNDVISVKKRKVAAAIDDLDDVSIEIINLIKDMDEQKKESILNFIKTFK
mgnify:CR=1 FL=1